MTKIWFKRVGILLLGLTLIALGASFLIFGDRTHAFELFLRLWPIFLVLAGLVRLSGFLLDRDPKSPLGGVLLLAVGGILLTAAFRGDSGFGLILAKYWFFLLLAFVAGRLIAEYARANEYGDKRRTFGPGTISIALLICGVGLGAHFVSKDPNLQARFSAPFEKLAAAGKPQSRFTFGEKASDVIRIASGKRLSVVEFPGNVEVHGSGPGPAAVPSNGPDVRVFLIKRIFAESQSDAAAIADPVRLQIDSRASETRVQTAAFAPNDSVELSLLIEVPDGSIQSLELVRSSGPVKVTSIEVPVKLSEPRQSVVLKQIEGDVTVDGASALVDASTINGNLTIRSSSGDAVKASDITGSLEIKADQTSVEADEIQGPVKVNARRNIKVTNFEGPLRVTSAQGAIELVLNSVPAFDIIAETGRGGAKLSLPAESIFRLEALTQSGRIRIRGFDHLGLGEEWRETRVNFEPGSPAPLIHLKSSKGDVLISSSGNAVAVTPTRPVAPTEAQQK